MERGASLCVTGEGEWYAMPCLNMGKNLSGLLPSLGEGGGEGGCVCTWHFLSLLSFIHLIYTE